MANVNCVFLMGNLTRDPELRYSSSGAPVTNMSIAVNNSYTDKSGERKEDTLFIRVAVFGKQAETTAQYLFKGSPVFVEGRLKLNEWTTEQGEKRNSIEVVARNVQFLGKRDSSGQSQENQTEEEG
jgi:single-strand DNA-binding protein